MKNFLHGLLSGLLTTLPLYLMAEQIRYGFVSNHLAIWVLVFVIGIVGLVQYKDSHFSFLTRSLLFLLYVLVVSVLLIRTVLGNGLLLAVLLPASLYACYEVFHIARKI